MSSRLRRVIEAPVLFSQWWLPVSSIWSRFCLRVAARYHGGKITLLGNVVVSHAVRFQGRGQLILESNVRLGYYLAGAIDTPILLQPREADSEIRVGQSSAIMNGCEIIARTKISIGSACLIGAQAMILDADFHGISPAARRLPGEARPIVIEDNVWIGSRATLLKGVHVGHDAVIASNCVVTKDVASGSIVAGNPMRVIGSVYARDH